MNKINTKDLVEKIEKMTKARIASQDVVPLDQFREAKKKLDPKIILVIEDDETMRLAISAPAPPIAPKYTAPCRFMASITSALRSPLPTIPDKPWAISFGEYASIRPLVVGPAEPIT